MTKKLLGVVVAGLFLMGCKDDGFMATKEDAKNSKLTQNHAEAIQGAWYSACIEDIEVDTKNNNAETSTGFHSTVFVFEDNGQFFGMDKNFLDSKCLVEKTQSTDANGNISSPEMYSYSAKYGVSQEESGLMLNFSFGEEQEGLSLYKIKMAAVMASGKLSLKTVAESYEQLGLETEGKQALSTENTDLSTRHPDELLIELYRASDSAQKLQRKVRTNKLIEEAVGTDSAK